MFELCKKVEVYNIENNYYFSKGYQIEPELANKLGLHKLKIKPIATSFCQFASKAKMGKKGLQLSKTIDCIKTSSRGLDIKTQEPDQYNNCELFPVASGRNYRSPIYSTSQFLRMKTNATQNNQNMAVSLHSDYEPLVKTVRRRSSATRIQSITLKAKPHCSTVSNYAPTNFAQLSLQKNNYSQDETVKNLTDTKPPASSKIETCYTYALHSSQHLASKWQPENNLSFAQIHEASSSKLISISKSVSSVQQTINEKDHKRYDLSNDAASRSDREISISLSNIFGREDAFGSQQKRLHRDSPMKRLSLFLDSQRNTIESRLSREIDFPDEENIKIQQSFICEHNPKSNFQILECNQIKKKDYVVNQAIETNLNIVVSLKQFLSCEMKIIVQQLQVYEIIENYLCDQPQYKNILELYQVQHSQGSHLLIREPYTISLQAKLKKVNIQQAVKLRERAKNIASDLIDFLQKYNMRPTRKFTTHEFVLCIGELKIQDLSIFKHQHQSLLSKEEVLSGVDI